MFRDFHDFATYYKNCTFKSQCYAYDAYLEGKSRSVVENYLRQIK